jgi:hypothetical protein
MYISARFTATITTVWLHLSRRHERTVRHVHPHPFNP